jgi:hypothetical protein
MLLPGESKRFLFTFISKKVGIFTEAWDLHTDPLVVKPIPQLILTGRAFEPDKMIAPRHFFEKEFNKRITLHTAEEILTDIVRSVRTPTPPPPDLEDSKECQEQFEAKNIDEQVWHTNEIIELFRELEGQVKSLIPQESLEPWDLKIENFRKMIAKIQKPEAREDKMKRLNFLVKLAKAKPPNRSLYWNLTWKITGSDSLGNSLRRSWTRSRRKKTIKNSPGPNWPKAKKAKLRMILEKIERLIRRNCF